jgi:catechol 2,3-dioxygenase-like lactoylglutathione lyase family enzyme
MRPRIDVITLAVEDLDRALDFYRRGLGLSCPGIVGTEFTGDDVNSGGAAAMFELEGGSTLALYPRSELAKDAAVPLHKPASGGFSIGHVVTSRQEVDAVLAAALAAGGRLTAPARDRPWGIYSGYFQDLDGHLWEVLWNPALGVEGSGD